MKFPEDHCSRYSGIPQGGLFDDNRRHIEMLCVGMNTGVYNICASWRSAVFREKSSIIPVSMKMATVDNDRLTRLVLLAHENRIRISVEPCNFDYIKLAFWTRDRRSARIYDIHPTIECAVHDVRRAQK